MSEQQSPFQPPADPVTPLLQADDRIPDSVRSHIHDIFWDSADHHELAIHLAPLNLPTDLKEKVWQIKKDSMPVASPLDKVSSAIEMLKRMDPETRRIAEDHPSVMRAFIDATKD